MADNGLTKREWHLKQAKDCFNKTWDYLDQEKLTDKQVLEMLHTAHTSVFHWAQVGTELNLARGEWQVSRAYSVAKRPIEGFFHAEASLKLLIPSSLLRCSLPIANVWSSNCQKSPPSIIPAEHLAI